MPAILVQSLLYELLGFFCADLYVIFVADLYPFHGICCDSSSKVWFGLFIADCTIGPPRRLQARTADFLALGQLVNKVRFSIRFLESLILPISSLSHRKSVEQQKFHNTEPGHYALISFAHWAIRDAGISESIRFGSSSLTTWAERASISRICFVFPRPV